MSTPLLPRLIEEYAEQYTSPEGAVLAALNRETNIKRGDAIMLSGHIQGALLQMLSKMIRPLNILEIGTFTGYSAICLAQGLREGGKLHTLEIDEELYDLAHKYVVQAGLEDKIELHTGVAAELIPKMDIAFDLVFIDADKLNYCNYYDLIFDKVPVGGFIIADNVLYDGEVVLPYEQQCKNARMIQLFNDKIKNDDRIEHMLLPVRDGLMVVRKKG
jgi:predicted O-methyltransferase YrrM